MGMMTRALALAAVPAVLFAGASAAMASYRPRGLQAAVAVPYEVPPAPAPSRRPPSPAPEPEPMRPPASAPGAAVFPDVPEGHWASDAIGELSGAGIIAGDPDGAFRPEVPVTREEWAVSLARALRLQPGGPSRFPDARGRWSEPYIAATEKPEIYIGYPDGLMRPGQAITRAELAAVVVRTLRTTGVRRITPDLYFMPFPDGIGHWARDDIAVATALGYFVGYPDGTFRPDQTATKAEAATVLWRIWRDLGRRAG